MDGELDGADIFDNWDQLIQSPNASEPPLSPELEIGDLIEGQKKEADYWEHLFQTSNFGGMRLASFQYHPLTIHEEDFFKAYTAAKKEFIQDIFAHHANDLRVAGISEENIFYLSKSILPVNWTVHLKCPSLYGGQADPDNMVMIQCQPFHELIHDFINNQILTAAGVGHPKTLYVPMPVGKIYIPEAKWAGDGQSFDLKES